MYSFASKIISYVTGSAHVYMYLLFNMLYAFYSKCVQIYICVYISIYLSIYIIESVCLFVCLFAVNAKTTARIDPKCWGITKNNPESVLCCLKSPALVFLERYRDISGFSFTADRHFHLISTSGSCLDA